MAPLGTQTGSPDWDTLLEDGLGLEYTFGSSIVDECDTLYFSGSTKWVGQDRVLHALAPYATGEYRGAGEEPDDLFLFVLAQGVCVECPGRITYDTSRLPEGVTISE